MQAGDLLFYTSDGGIIDKAIAMVTGSRFVHVAIAINETEKVEMIFQGCIRSPINESAIAAVWIYPIKDRELLDFNEGMHWLLQQVGKPYGWNDVLEALDTQHRFLWLQTGHSDCSHLAYDFLLRSGYTRISRLSNDASRVTPASLARFLQIK